MEKLDKVIAGLEFCGEANKNVDSCLAMCPYYGERDGDKVCMDFLMEDALAVIRDLTEKLKMAKNGRLELGRRIHELEKENKRMIRELGYARSERAATWGHLSENGEYVPEAPREGM